MQYTAPIPPPSMLREYDEIVPGSAEQMMAEVKKETSHRRKIQNKIITAKIEDQRRSQNHAFYVAIGFLVVAAIAIIYNQPWVAVLFGGSGIAGVVMALKQGKSK